MADLRSDLTCCICMDIYTDPVTLTCGHNYCQKCITRAWDSQGERRQVETCPECRQRFWVRPDLKRNLTLCKIADDLKKSAEPMTKIVAVSCTYCDSPVQAAKTCLHCEASLCEKHLTKHCKLEEHVLMEPTTSLENRKCPVHKKILQYYCCEDATCICVSCRLDGKHKGHKVETLNEASEKKLRNILEKVTSNREKVEKRVLSLEEHRKQEQEKAARVTEGVTVLIREVREQLDILEKRALSEMSRKVEQVSLQVSDLIRQLKTKKDNLTRKIGDIEQQLRNVTDPLTVLQELDRDEYCNTEEGDDEIVERDPLDVELNTVNLHSVTSNIVDSVISWQNVLESSLEVKKVSDMLLDINTAGNNLVISDDLKKLYWSVENLRRPESPERFPFPQVLSIISFSSGRHYWEVEVGKSGEWSIGMSYSSIARRGDDSGIGENSKSWSLSKWSNNYYKASHDSHMIRLPYLASCNRLGIYLDYGAGRLSFYELCDPIRHLNTFTAAFTEPLHTCFWVWHDSSLPGQDLSSPENCHLRII